MINAKVNEALNKQMNNEMYSAYLYMAMSAHSSHIGLNGFAHWFMVQYHEEMLHAMKFYNYILDQGGTVELRKIEQPPVEFASPLDMFEKTLTHEQFITRCIHELTELAMTEKDFATQIFLQWYVTEQVEEEKNDNEILAKLRFVKNDTSGLFMLDNELGARALTVQTDFSQGIVAPANA